MTATAIITARANSIARIRALLYPQVHIVSGSERTTPYGSTAVLVTAPVDRAQAQEDRFGSGLVGARVHDAFDAALAHGRDEIEVNWEGITDPSGPRILATVQLQYWSNNYAVDASAPFTIDVTEPILAMSAEARAALEDNTHQSDALYLNAADAGIAHAHEGPFYVSVRDSIDEYFELVTA